jgi:hypothetical protein
MCQSQPVEDLLRLRRCDLVGEQGRRTRRAHRDPPSRRSVPVLHDASGDRAARPGRHELGSPGRTGLEGLGVGAALEPMGRLGVQVQAPSREQDAGPGERCRFEQHVDGVVGDLRGRPTHDARDRHGALGVADQQVAAGHGAVDAVEGAHTLALRRPTHDDARSFEAVQVEGVQGLTELQHRVVRSIDDR